MRASKLTALQIAALRDLHAGRAEISKRTLNSLLRLGLLEAYTPDGKIRRYRLNLAGRMAVQGLKLIT